MRGRLADFGNFKRYVRNTHAYAGKTQEDLIANWNCEKHPRVCGEDGARELIQTLKQETPRVYGEDASRVPPMNERAETPPRMRGRQVYNVAVQDC